MRYLWLDTETTGLDVSDSAPFQISMILVDGGEVVAEKEIRLNPLSDRIVWHKEVEDITGITEQDVMTYQPEASGVRELVAFLKVNLVPGARYIMAGYNIRFDFQHIEAQMDRYGYSVDEFFDRNSVADVFRQVKAACHARILPWMPNRKLGTVCGYLRVDLEKAHDAMSDIRATREVAHRLHSYGCGLITGGLAQ